MEESLTRCRNVGGEDDGGKDGECEQAPGEQQGAQLAGSYRVVNVLHVKQIGAWVKQNI